MSTHATRYTGNEDSWCVISDGRKICGGSNKLNGTDAALIVEAFNVKQETGKTPRQLADENQTLSDIVQKLAGARRSTYRSGLEENIVHSVLRKAEEFVRKSNKKEP